ncbi:unnamed protein product [Urochloa decumbens]|uniref:BTB domain-containing protein n=1 Tax=Urochloa decumbens TaxID=240449 RepID=A0ABC8WBN4_9POAL
MTGAAPKPSQGLHRLHLRIRSRRPEDSQPPAAAAAMNHSCTQHRQVVTSVLQLKVDGSSITKSRCHVEVYDWEIRFHPALHNSGVGGHTCWLGLVLVFLGGEAHRTTTASGVTAILSSRIIDKSSDDSRVMPFKMAHTVANEFRHPLDQSPQIYIGQGKGTRDDFKNCKMTVECSVTVLRGSTLPSPGDILVPPSDLPQHLGELLRNEAGADVRFTVSGSSETFAAHKNVLAARSPVFMAEFFGAMKEKDSQCVEILDMDATVFKAMLHLYRRSAGDLREANGSDHAQHLLVAADRYGLDRLKVMCERRLALGMDASMVASTLAVAEKHNCSRLKAMCVEFITGGSPENLDAVLATDGYKDLAASSPTVLAELLKAAHGRKRSRSPDTQ